MNVIHKLVWLVMLIAANVTAQDLELLQVADYLDYERVSGAQISPDGRQVIYTRLWVDQQKDRTSSALWIVNVDGSSNRFLVQGAAARWSPSGDRILFIANDANAKPQLFVRWMDAEGSVTQVTRGNVRPSSPHWAPDGETIAFVAIVPASNTWRIELPTAPKGATWTKEPRLLERLHYRQDGIGFTEPGFSHLFTVPASSGTARQLTEGEWNVGARFDALYQGAGLSWTPDSKAIVFDGLRDESDTAYRQSHLYSIDVATRAITQLTVEPGSWTAPEVSANGRLIAYFGYATTAMTYEMPQLHMMNVDGSEAHVVARQFDRPAGGLHWAPNNKGVYFEVQEDGYVNVYYANLQGELRAVTQGKHVQGLDSIDGRGARGVGIATSFYKPNDVYSFALRGRGDPAQVTDVNADLLIGKTLGGHEEIWFEASDGNQAHGWIVKPPDFDANKTYPLLLEIHGGPFAMYTGRFDFSYQTFASNNFVVVYTNSRGSTGYGESFTQAIDHAYPSVDYLDLMGAVDAVVREGYIDTERMYVGGCSGGGILSSWVIGHTDRFAAAAVRCPVANWLSMAGTTDVPYFTYSFFKKPFWEDPSDWLEHSSIMHVGKVTTPPSS